MSISGCKSLPVAMYHYVNDLEGGITLSPSRFEEHCRSLAEKGWRGVGLAEAESFLINGEALPPKSLLLTFDDGYLDNYLCALPVLHKYGHKAVVFAVSNRLGEGESPRAGLEETLEGRAKVPPHVRMPVQETAQGFTVRRDVFLNRAEARLMDGQGSLAVASHGRGHFGVCLGPEFSGFHQPRTRYRTFYRTEEDPVWGMPEFKVKAGLLHRAFLPNPDMVEAVKKLVPQDFDGAADFFARPVSVKELEALIASFAANMGRYENDDERRERMWREIHGGKAELEAVLGHPVRSLCWPWGQYCEEAFQLARDAGFELFFTTKEGTNRPGRPEAVRRFKAKDKSGAWMLWRARLYSRPLLGNVYAKLRM